MSPLGALPFQSPGDATKKHPTWAADISVVEFLVALCLQIWPPRIPQSCFPAHRRAEDGLCAGRSTDPTRDRKAIFARIFLIFFASSGLAERHNHIGQAHHLQGIESAAKTKINTLCKYLLSPQSVAVMPGTSAISALWPPRYWYKYALPEPLLFFMNPLL